MYRKISIALTLVFASTSIAQAQLNNTQRGALGGGAAGAVIGGIIGNQNDETPEGALIGGAVGAIAGSILGQQQDRAENQYLQQRAAYQQQQAQVQAQRFANGLSVGDVVALSQTGVNEAVIVQQIQQHGIQQQIGVNEIISLHRQGVSNNVISTLQRAHFAGATPAQGVGPVVPSAHVGINPPTVIRPVVTPPAIVVNPRPVVVSRPSVVITTQPRYAPPKYVPKYGSPRYAPPRYAPPKSGYSRSANARRGAPGYGPYRR